MENAELIFGLGGGVAVLVLAGILAGCLCYWRYNKDRQTYDLATAMELSPELQAKRRKVSQEFYV